MMISVLIYQANAEECEENLLLLLSQENRVKTEIFMMLYAAVKRRRNGDEHAKKNIHDLL